MNFTRLFLGSCGAQLGIRAQSHFSPREPFSATLSCHLQRGRASTQCPTPQRANVGGGPTSVQAQQGEVPACGGRKTGSVRCGVSCPTVRVVLGFRDAMTLCVHCIQVDRRVYRTGNRCRDRIPVLRRDQYACRVVVVAVGVTRSPLDARVRTFCQAKMVAKRPWRPYHPLSVFMHPRLQTVTLTVMLVVLLSATAAVFAFVNSIKRGQRHINELGDGTNTPCGACNLVGAYALEWCCSVPHRGQA